MPWLRRALRRAGGLDVGGQGGDEPGHGRPVHRVVVQQHGRVQDLGDAHRSAPWVKDWGETGGRRVVYSTQQEAS